MIQLIAIDVRGEPFWKHRRAIDLLGAGITGRGASGPA